MADVQTEILDLRRKVDFAKSTAVSAQRRIDGLASAKGGRRQPDPAAQIVRSMTVALKAMVSGRPFAETAARLYGETAVARLVEIASDPSAVVSKAQTDPAMTTVAAWAAELAGSAVLPLALLSPLSVYGQLQRRPTSLKIPFGPGVRSVRLPAQAPGDSAGAFLGEGQPIPVVKKTLSAAATNVFKVGAISTFTKEMARNAAFEVIVRQVVASDLGTVIDSTLLDADAATDLRPAGLRFGATDVPASAESGATGVASDLAALAGAIEAAVDLVFVARAETVLKAILLSPAAANLNWLPSTTIDATTVLAADASDYATGEGSFVFDATEESVVVNADEAPIGDIGTESTSSLFQQALIGIRCLSDIGWQMRRPGRVAVVEEIGW